MWEDAIFIMDDDGSNVTHLIDDSPENVQFTLDDEKIIINRLGGGIWSMNIDGTDVKNLTSKSVGSELPSLSPDSTKIAFSTGDIYTMNIDGTNVQNLTNTPDVRDRYPHFSPDGDFIVYATDSDSETTISIIDKNGENTQKVISTSTEPYPCYYYYPRFNINGDEIYYIFFGEEKGLYSVDISDSTSTTLLFEGSVYTYFLSIPDDGSKIVFSANSHIYILNTDDSEIMDLGYGGSPMISSNGEKILFNGVKIMNSDGSELTKLEYGWDPRFSRNKYNGHYKVVYIDERKINKKINKGIVS